jgi:hypothetical protein
VPESQACYVWKGTARSHSLIVPDDATATANSIVADEMLFRVDRVCELFHAVGSSSWSERGRLSVDIRAAAAEAPGIFLRLERSGIELVSEFWGYC